MLKATSRFGAEFDSLSDFLCFGVAPPFVLYLWSLHRAGAYGYAACVMFSVCMALRLARFNASLDGAPKPAYAYSFFTGVPAPLGLGTTRLADGTTPKGFIVEAQGVIGARDISEFGGWRAYIASLNR